MAGIMSANTQINPQANVEWPQRWTGSEKKFVILVIIGVLIATSIPFAYAYLTTPQDKQFMGIMLDVPDHAQYFSWLRELTTQNLAANKMTPEPNRPLFFNLLWWGMGRIGSLFGVGYAFMFQVLTDRRNDLIPAVDVPRLLLVLQRYAQTQNSLLVGYFHIRTWLGAGGH